MARKTIASLEEQIRVLNRQLDEIGKANTRLINEKAKLIEAEDNTFQNSCLYAQMKKEIDYLNLRVKTKEGILETRNKKIDKQALLIQELLTENEKLKNENEELKIDKDKLSNLQLENNLLKGVNEVLKVQKDIEQNNIEEVKNENLDSYKRKAERLEAENDNLKRENADLKTNFEIQINQIKLDRAVGRPKKISDDIVQKVIELRKAKKSIRAIAKELNISVGSVHNIVHNIIEQL